MVYDSGGDGLSGGPSCGNITVNYDSGEYELEVEDFGENNFGSSASATFGASTTTRVPQRWRRLLNPQRWHRLL